MRSGRGRGPTSSMPIHRLAVGMIGVDPRKAESACPNGRTGRTMFTPLISPRSTRRAVETSTPGSTVQLVTETFGIEIPDAYGFTIKDVVPSSLFVHENKLQNALELFDYKEVASALTRGKGLGTNLGKLPGLFTLPICRNPGREAISSVWETKGRNHPCMCRDFGRNNHSWNINKDETKQFLILRGLMFSEDWEHFCNKNGHCKGHNNIDIHSSLDRLRKPGDSQIPRYLKHPFKKCEQKTEHRAGNPSQDFSANPPT